jgi:hypothetical protein
MHSFWRRPTWAATCQGTHIWYTVWIEGTASRYGGWLRMQWISCCSQPTSAGPPSWGLGMELTTAHHKNKIITKLFNDLLTWTDSLGKRPTLTNTDMRSGFWNIRSTYRAGSLMNVLKELCKYKLDLVGMQEVRWECGGTKPAGEYTLWKVEWASWSRYRFFVHKKFISAGKRVKFYT